MLVVKERGHRVLDALPQILVSWFRVDVCDALSTKLIECSLRLHLAHDLVDERVIDVVVHVVG